MGILKMSKYVRKIFQRTLSDVSAPPNYTIRLSDSFTKAENEGNVIPAFKKAVLNANRIAVKDDLGEYSYYQVYMGAKKLSRQISNICGSAACSNVACFVSNDVVSPMVQWSCWISGQVVVPLICKLPVEVLKHIIRDSKAKLIVANADHEKLGFMLAAFFELPVLIVDHEFIEDHEENMEAVEKQLLVGLDSRIMLAGTLEHDFYSQANAMILYSIATTGQPKGIVLTHRNIHAQSNSLINAWNFNSKDSLLLVLPLHHLHSHLTSLLCLLNVGGKIVMHKDFDSHNVWKSLLGINTAAKDRVNVFFGVPSMYSFLISEYEKIFATDSQMVEYIKNFCKINIRLMVSGSAPLAENIFKKWKEITGHNILERYGMAEFGIGFSNPYVEKPVHQIRRPGFIGLPLPGVKARIVNDEGKTLLNLDGEKNQHYWKDLEDQEKANIRGNQPVMWEVMGELEVGGDNVFKKYFNSPEITTTSSFDEGFFKTGDEVAFVNGAFKLLGRINTDIIMTGGYKVYSAEVESTLLDHPDIEKAVVIGAPDSIWGERVVAICVLKPNKTLNLKDVRTYCCKFLPTYKLPSVLKVVEEIPKNNLLQVDKEHLGTLIEAKNTN